MVEGGGEMLDRRVCIIGCVCVPLIGGGEATLTHPNERGVGGVNGGIHGRYYPHRHFLPSILPQHL